jgi:DNA-binding NarL/FixJ family response regulator
MNHQTQRTLRVLLLEDGEAAGAVRQNLAGAGMSTSIFRAASRPAFERALREFAPDVVIADAGLQQVEPALALELVRARSPQLPVVFLEPAAGRAAVRELYQAGAAEYVSRDGLWRIGAAVRSALARVRAAREHLLARAAAEHLRLVARHLQQAA